MGRVAEVAIVVAGVIAGTVPARAGLLELLLGSAPAQPRIEQPLEMTVRPNRSARPAKPKYGTDDGVPHVKAIPIDPVSNPTWYLTDPTLRAGDIVVLPQKVLVYTGGREQRRLADFDDLKGARSLSSKDRERVRLLTEYSRGPAVKYTIIKAPDLSNGPADEPIQAKQGAPARSILINTASDTSG